MRPELVFNEVDEFERSDFRMADDLGCEALGVALTWDGIAVSLPSDEKWRATQVSISQHLYDVELTECTVVKHRVRHASIPDHVDWVVDDWRKSASAKVNGVNQLIEHWELLFPQLDLCEEYRSTKGFPALLARKPGLSPVLHRLRRIPPGDEQAQGTVNVELFQPS